MVLDAGLPVRENGIWKGRGARGRMMMVLRVFVCIFTLANHVSACVCMTVSVCFYFVRFNQRGTDMPRKVDCAPPRLGRWGGGGRTLGLNLIGLGDN